MNYNAGATVLHLHVRELDGKGSKRLSVEETLAANGFAPNPKGRQQGHLRKVA